MSDREYRAPMWLRFMWVLGGSMSAYALMGHSNDPALSAAIGAFFVLCIAAFR